uniref:NADH-ubiquinone oxidoreductase chain 6 n=1 Tax=Pityogenes bidentatus TaxID=1325381 RepID=A0A2D0VPV7_9CUCU|nr:NADH dehydrogenase subunit 6 [Pityogenes bidentatus]AOY40173.1 NADH dehydrogenase subunit 6 [Pityogenes bidentatus]
MFLLTSMNFTLSMMFIFLNHPLALGGNLFLQTVLIALISGNLIMNFWYSYLLFLIMVGGMLILFIYMTSIASNEKFLIPKYYKSIMLILLMFLFCIFLFTINDKMIEKQLSIKWMYMYENLNYKPWTLSKFFNSPFSQIIIFLMIYLFLTLVMTVKVTTNTPAGALRQK